MPTRMASFPLLRTTSPDGRDAGGMPVDSAASTCGAGGVRGTCRGYARDMPTDSGAPTCGAQAHNLQASKLHKFLRMASIFNVSVYTQTPDARLPGLARTYLKRAPLKRFVKRLCHQASRQAFSL
eukprot:1160765-Pelagomonas_calceolata.AAC.4